MLVVGVGSDDIVDSSTVTRDEDTRELLTEVETRGAVLDFTVLIMGVLVLLGVGVEVISIGMKLLDIGIRMLSDCTVL